MGANKIYRSEAFNQLSGYPQDQIDENLGWWFSHVHPDDRERVNNKVNQHIADQKERWEDEYRFQCADGAYKYLHDTGVILYKNGNPVRILGAIRDITDQKKLEKQLLDEQAQKHQAITLATITAQEQEKTNISRELHDNVNQILMSAKLFMDTAKKIPAEADILLDKAIEYQLIALHEIRKLSRSLNTSHIKTAGLKESVQDILDNLRIFKKMEVVFNYNSAIDNLVSEEQKLTLFRIIQEQSNNIIKYAAASTVQIDIKLDNDNGFIHLYIKDNGQGFDTSVKQEKGIGLANIKNRMEAHNGSMQVVSSPGNGCLLEVGFPV
jgi:PAS domain S-box-containing protein